MKKIITILCCILFLLPLLFTDASDLSSSLKGRILLQVEDNGEAWYVEPDTQKRAFLGRPDDAFRIMRELGLGVSEKDFNSFGEKAPTRLSGRILLRVEANGEAYYVNPVDLKMHFLGRPADAFQVMRNLGLGITNENLNKVSIFEKYNNNNERKQNKNNIESVPTLEPITPEPEPITPEPEQETEIICNAWTYSDWSECQPNGIKIRNVIESYPSNCIGGNPEISRTCVYYEEEEYSDYNFTYSLERTYDSMKIYFTNPTHRNIVIKEIPVSVPDNDYVTNNFYVRYRPSPGATNKTISLEKVNDNLYKFIGQEISIKQPSNHLGVYDKFIKIGANRDIDFNTNIKDWVIWDNDANKQVLYEEIQAELEFNSDKTSVYPGESITLTWSAQNTESCVASGNSNWNGNKNINGSEIIIIDSNSSLKLTCESGSGEVSKIINIDLMYDIHASRGGGYTEVFSSYHKFSSHYISVDAKHSYALINEIDFNVYYNFDEELQIFLKNDSGDLTLGEVTCNTSQECEISFSDLNLEVSGGSMLNLGLYYNLQSSVQENSWIDSNLLSINALVFPSEEDAVVNILN